jgi:hypothetical protein
MSFTGPSECGVCSGSRLKAGNPAGLRLPWSLTAVYRQFGGIRIPTTVTTRIGDIDQIISLRDVVLDSLDDAVFTPPPAVRDLIRG